MEPKMKKIKAIEIVNDQTSSARCDEGFLKIKRYLIKNIYDDDSESRPYNCDIMNRRSIDAVAVVIYFISNNNISVILRRCLRPPVFFRKDFNLKRYKNEPDLFVIEIVAGLLEDGEINETLIQKRAAIEVFEETGYEVNSDEIIKLGTDGVFSSPGCSSEKVYFRGIKIDPDMKRAEALGDGSLMEEGGSLLIVELDEALRMCKTGKICDGKTEIGLTRLKHFLETA